MLVGIYIGQFCINTLTIFFLTWFPSYLVQARHMSIPKAGLAAALPATRTPELLAAWRPLLPMLSAAQSVLHTGLTNFGAILHPVIALLTAGVEMDVLGLAYDEYSDSERKAIVKAFPRSARFKEDIIQTFYEGIKHKPETTFGNVKADVLAVKDPHFHRGNFCRVIRESRWPG